MRSIRLIKDYIKKIPVKLILLTALTVALVGFFLVSTMSYTILKEITVSKNTIINKELIKTSLTQLVIINISMTILFVFIILVVTKIFKNMNNYAFYSCITGLPNKTFVLNSLVGEISRIKEFSAMISLDMDNFKAVNDTLGHLSGDELLRQAGRRFKKIIKPEDCVCHIGGDEFLFFIKSTKTKSEVEEVAKEIISIFKKSFIIDGKNVDYVTASIGIALIPQDGNDFQTIYNCADDAMYSAKSYGKNSYRFYDKSMSFHIYEESVKKKEIEKGIMNKEFKVFYQPKFSGEGVLIGAEALVRWFKSDGRMVTPSEFISFAEKNGLITSITEFVIDEVCRKIISWIEKGYNDFSISINITADHLINEKLCNNILEKIKGFNIEPKYMEFEITETMIIKDFRIAVNSINKIKNFGIKISLDDFGTGYSSLNYLKELPINIIKIDKSFIDTISEDEKDKILLESIINIAHSFKYDIVAEGVENKNQYEILKSMRCDAFQGYYLGRPADEYTFENSFLKLYLKNKDIISL